jgi:hypothetical protein
MRITAESVDIFPCFNEGLLYKVVGIIVREYHIAYVPIDFLAVLVNNNRKGCVPQGAVLELFQYYLLIVVCHGFIGFSSLDGFCGQRFKF